jgi:hypothetical protein
MPVTGGGNCACVRDVADRIIRDESRGSMFVIFSCQSMQVINVMTSVVREFSGREGNFCTFYSLAQPHKTSLKHSR